MTESWIFHFDLEPNQQNSQWKSTATPTPPKAKVVKNAGKVIWIIIFDHDRLNYQQAVVANLTITVQCYVTVLRSMLQHFEEKRPNQNDKEILLHNKCAAT